MTPLGWIGVATYLVGAVAWFAGSRRGYAGPKWVARLGLGMMALGLSTIALVQEGSVWTIASIVLSILAIVLIVSVLRDTLRR